MIETEIFEGDTLLCEREMFGAGGGHATYRYKVLDVQGDKIKLLRVDREDVGTTMFERSFLTSHSNWHKLKRESQDEFVKVIKTAPSREWVESFLDMTAKLINITGVTEDDDQLVMSIRTDQKSLPISLGNRYCLKGYPADQKVGVILPHGSAAVDELREKACHTGQFNGEADAPHWYKFPAASADDLRLGEYHEDWQQALKAERERGHRRVRGDAHEPVVYRAAINSAVRQQLIDDARFDS